MNLEAALTQFIRSITSAFGAAHPIRFSVGILLGYVLHGIGVKLLAAAFPHITWLKAASDLGVIPYIALGLLISFGLLARRKNLIPEKTIEQLSTIEEILERAGFSDSIKRQIWRDIIQKYLDSMSIDLGPDHKKLEVAANEAIARTEKVGIEG